VAAVHQLPLLATAARVVVVAVYHKPVVLVLPAHQYRDILVELLRLI